MNISRGLRILGIGLILLSFWLGTANLPTSAQSEPPSSPVKLVFIHHSSGENWLSDNQGGLARALQEANFFVSDTNYGWGPDGIGDRTDIVNWPEWFRDSESQRFMEALFAESEVHSPFERILPDPGGENEIVLFKSCFPNSDLSGNPDDPPRQEDGLTVSNVKYIYKDLLKYFASRPDKLFVVITAPPLIRPSQPENARAFNTWLVEDWLEESGYTQNNVAVFDYFNILTDPDNHHRLVDGQVEYVTSNGKDTLYYDTEGDDHANPAGNRKATEEFVPLLNEYYHRWAVKAPRQPVQVPPGQSGSTADQPMPEPASQDSQAEEHAAQVEQTSGAAGSFPRYGVIDDFDTTGQTWEAFWQDGNQTSLVCAPVTLPEHGRQALQIEFNVQPNTWATCELNLGENQDWSAGRGLSFAIHASDPALVMDVVVFGNDPGARLPYAFSLETAPEMTEGWVNFELTWDVLVQPEYEASPGTSLDPNQVNGIAFAFNTFPDTPNSGTIWIDDLRLVGEADPPQAEAVQAAQIEITPEEGGTTETGKGGGLCAAPIFLVGLTLLGVGLCRPTKSL